MHNIPQTRKHAPAVLFPNGVNSYVDPQLLPDGQVRWAINAVCKGAIWQTRPGFKTRYSIDVVNNGPMREWHLNQGQPVIVPQFMQVVSMVGKTPYLIFGISGSVFQAKINPDLSLDTPAWVPTLKFDPTVRQIATAMTIKSADMVNGVAVTVDPYPVLMLQDGVSAAGYWTYTYAGHLNQTPKWSQNANGDTIFESGYNQTPQGRWMAWSGNRLWVAVGSQLYASNLNDPLNFTESITFRLNVSVLNFPDVITGLHDRGVTGSTSSKLFVFTHNQTWAISTGLLRENWSSTVDFQVKIYDGVGCIAGKSITAHRGLLHWYSDNGIVEHNTINTAYSTQSLPPIDSEMAASKAVMASDRSTICCGSRDSYAFWSVPAGQVIKGRIVNGHTQVLDKNVVPGLATSGSIAAWQGVWTGINPVEWVTATAYSKTFTWALSFDNDGVVRIWEAFQGNRSDNGFQIPWTIETKTHQVSETPFSNRVFRHFQAQLLQIRGNLSFKGFWKGLRGHYKQTLDTKITATPGSLLIPDEQFTPHVNKTPAYNCKKQTRIIRSQDERGPDDADSSAGVENRYTDSVDSAFSLLFKFIGVGALRSYWIATDAFADNTEGEVIPDEIGLRVLPEPADAAPFAKTSVPTPDYVIPDDVPALAFSPLDPNFEDELYSATPADNTDSETVNDGSTTNLSEILELDDYRLFNPVILELDVPAIPTPATVLLDRSSSYLDSEGSYRSWRGTQGASGVVFDWTTTADEFSGLLTGYPGDYNYRWEIENGAFVVTPQLKNIDAPTPGPGPIL